MVAEKILSAALSGNMCSVTQTVGRVPVHGNKFDGVRTQELQLQSEKLPEELGLDNFCEVILSYRCKFCTFVAVDRSLIKFHIDSTHTPQDHHEKLPDESLSNGTNGRRADSGISEKLQVHNQQCSKCPSVCENETSLKSHIAEMHLGNGVSVDTNGVANKTCEPEDKKTSKRRRVSGPGEVTCYRKSAGSVKTVFRCNFCKSRFRTAQAVEIHVKCHIITEEQSGEQQNAKKTKTSFKGYSCYVCSTNTADTYLTWAKCSLHLWKEHQVDCDLHSCGSCGYKTTTLARLKEHELLHQDEAKFQCTTCNKNFKQYKQLKTHEKYHKNANSEPPPPSDTRWYTPKECPVCNRILSDSKCLKKHIRAVHNKMKPYVCNICGHTSARKAELQLHVRQHTGEKPFKCSQCSFSTGDHNSLRKHKRRHEDLKPYQCQHCDYSAIQSHAFKKHVLAVHPGQEIVFVCPKCSLVSVNEKAHAAHMKDHEDGRISDNDGDGSAASDEAGTSATISEEMERIDEDGGKSTNKFWLNGEDSIEIVDNGGITIPATETCFVNCSAPVQQAISSDSQLHPSLPQESTMQVIPIRTTVSEIERQESLPLLLPELAQSVDCFEAPKLPVSLLNVSSKELVGLKGPAIPPTGINSKSSFCPVDDTRAVSCMSDLLAETDCYKLNPYLLDTSLGDSTDLPDLPCNDHSNDGTLEKLLKMDVTRLT